MKGDAVSSALAWAGLMASESPDAQQRIMSWSAYDLQVRATAHSATSGQPGFVPRRLPRAPGRPGHPGHHHRGRAVHRRPVGAGRRRLPHPAPPRTWYARAKARTRGPSPGSESTRPAPGPSWPGRSWPPRRARPAEPLLPASSSSPPDNCPPSGNSGPALCKPPSSANASPDSGTSWSPAPRPGTATASPSIRPGPGRSPGRSSLPCASPRSTRPAFHDDAGFCPDCDAPYCYQHWHVSGTGPGSCPHGHQRGGLPARVTRA